MERTEGHPASAQAGRARSPFGVLAALALAALACQGRPVPLSAARGSSVLIPLSDANWTSDGVKVGYGTASAPDFQRGRMKLWLDSNPDVELSVRAVARAAPDPASRAALGQGSAFELAGQVIVLADVPATAPLGSWAVYAQRVVLVWSGNAWVEQLTSAPTYTGSLTILPETAAPTPFYAYPTGDVSGAIPDFVPMPRLRFGVATTPAGTPVGSLHLVVIFPSSRVEVRDVQAEPLLFSAPWGKSALVSWSIPAPDTLDVRVLVPEGIDAPELAIVFQLTHPSDPPASGGGGVSVSNFSVVTVEATDVDGAALSAAVGVKKIL